MAVLLHSSTIITYCFVVYTHFHTSETPYLDHRPKALDRRQRPIQGAAAVIADDHAARTGLNRQNSILGAQNPL